MGAERLLPYVAVASFLPYAGRGVADVLHAAPCRFSKVGQGVQDLSTLAAIAFAITLIAVPAFSFLILFFASIMAISMTITAVTLLCFHNYVCSVANAGGCNIIKIIGSLFAAGLMFGLFFVAPIAAPIVFLATVLIFDGVRIGKKIHEHRLDLENLRTENSRLVASLNALRTQHDRLRAEWMWRAHNNAGQQQFEEVPSYDMAVCPSNYT